MKIQGTYYLPGSSVMQNAILSKSADGVYISYDEEGDRRIGLSHISDRLGNVPRKIYFSNGSVFETEHNNAVDDMFELGGGWVSKLFKAETSWRTVSILAVACIGLVYSIFVYGLPLLASGAAWATPEIALSAIDRGSLSTVDKIMFSESKLSAEKKSELQKVFDEVVAASGQVSPMPKLHFRDGGRLGANAIALPGGSIIFTDQIVDLSEHPDELAGVVAHEIGHVSERHGLKQIYRVLGVGFMVAVIGGDSSQLIEEVIAQSVLLHDLSYSRRFEEESDEISVRLMHKIGRNPYAFVDLLDRIVPEGSNEKTGWLSTHPSNFDRRSSIKAIIDGL